jgi:hypothetical protein
VRDDLSDWHESLGRRAIDTKRVMTRPEIPSADDDWNLFNSSPLRSRLSSGRERDNKIPFHIFISNTAPAEASVAGYLIITKTV